MDNNQNFKEHKDDHVLGHTQSGKPINYRSEELHQKLNYTPQDHIDASKLHQKNMIHHSDMSRKLFSKNPEASMEHKKTSDQHSRAAFQHAEKGGMYKSEQMDNNQPQQLVYAFDGDEIGKRHAQAILSDDLDQVKEISEAITNANNHVRDFVEQNGGQWISGGGDEGSFIAPPEFVDLLEQLRKDYQYIIQATLSIGYGQTISQAGKALLVAKERGKDQVVQYDDQVEQEVQQIEEEGSEPESDEHKKIKAVLSSEPNSNEEPQNTDQEVESSDPQQKDNNLGYDSGYNNSDPEVIGDSYEANDVASPSIQKPNLTPQNPIPEATSADLPESERLMNEELPDPESQPAEQPKPGPKGYGDSESEENSTDVEGEQMEPQADMPIENATSDEAEQTEAENMGGEQHCPSCTCSDHQEPIEDVLDQHIDNAQDYQESIDDGQPSNTDELLDAHLDNSQDMLDTMDDQGISRPADYNEKDGDMGLSEEDAGEPDLSEVLQGGLDQHADNIQREKVTQMVGEALEGFKAQKKILDKAKEQAPELYDSCIAMLKAMIELCSLAGLDNSGEAEQEVNEIEGQAESPEEAPGAEGEQAPQDDACPNCGHTQEAPEAAPQEEVEEAAPGESAKAPQF